MAKNTNLLTLKNKQRIAALDACGLGGVDGAVVMLKSNGTDVTDVLRDELLAKCSSGQYVELELDVLAYEQEAGKPNRNYVRIKDSAMMAFGKTGAGKPFIRDHEHQNSMAVCGKIMQCETEKRGEGSYAVRQKVTLTAPWAVELALRNLMSTVSISWRATGAVKCSSCDEQVLTKCWHWPGDRLSEKTGDDGVKRKMRDRAGDIVVEWVYDSAEILETSPVPVPAVPTARIDGIRTKLSETLGININDDEDTEPTDEPTSNPTLENKTMKTDLELALEARVARLTKIAALSGNEKNYFLKLQSDDQEAFLTKTAAERVEIMTPVYTSENGTVFFSVDDPRLVEMAKERDEDRKAHKAQMSAVTNAALLSRADSELGHLSGTREARAAMLGAIEGIENAEQRAEALAALKDQDTKESKNFVRQGAGGSKTPKKDGGDPQTELDAMVEKHAEEKGISEELAYDAVLNTPAGEKLYSEIEFAKRPQN